MAGQAVENDKILFLPAPVRKEAPEDLFRKKEVVVFEQPARFKDITNKPVLILTEFRGRPR
jgi:hypothetical protein